MSCNFCNCCFCCCCPNCDNTPNPNKKPKYEPPVPVEQPKPKPEDPITTTRSLEPPIFVWPIEYQPTVEDWFKPPTNVETEDDYSFPPKKPTTDNVPLTPTYSVLPYTHADRITKSIELSQTVVTNQGPEPYWLAPDTWTNGWGEYDYSTPIDIGGKTPSEICPLLFKGGYTMKGLKQLYYEKMPFKDETAPTVAEIDAWNIEVILHLRRLVGNTTPLEGDPRLYLESAWADERRFTRYWDTAYPGTDGSAYGPCAISGGDHCGASFVPSYTDQAPYLTQYPGLQPFDFLLGGAEGVGAVNTDLPWALKIVQRISNWVCTEGTTGHAGPFFNRTKVGMSFWANIDANGNIAAGTTMRIKWL